MAASPRPSGSSASASFPRFADPHARRPVHRSAARQHPRPPQRGRRGRVPDRFAGPRALRQLWRAGAGRSHRAHGGSPRPPRLGRRPRLAPHQPGEPGGPHTQLLRLEPPRRSQGGGGGRARRRVLPRGLHEGASERGGGAHPRHAQAGRADRAHARGPPAAPRELLRGQRDGPDHPGAGASRARRRRTTASFPAARIATGTPRPARAPSAWAWSRSRRMLPSLPSRGCWRSPSKTRGKDWPSSGSMVR